MNKKMIFIAIPAVLLFLASCSTVPTIPSPVPPDPTGVSEPGSWGSVEMALSVDYSLLNPLDIPKYTRIKLSFLGEYIPPEDISEDNFLVFEDGKAQGFILSRITAVFKRLDIVLLVDVTGSMSSAIKGVKNSIKGFMDYLKTHGFDVRVAVVPFDDYAPSEDKKYDPEWLNLSDPDTVKDYVDQFTAYGGGDSPENSYGAILFAWNNVGWRPASQRIFILFTDARSHYRGESTSTKFDPKANKDDILKLILGRATLYMVAYTGSYSETDTDFSSPNDPREIAVRTGGFVIYLSYSEEADLTKIGIAESVVNTFFITFESNSPGKDHVVEVYYRENPTSSSWDGKATLHASY